MDLQPTKRRLFVTENSKDFYKLFTVKQGSEEGDIYFTWPDSANTVFLLLDNWKKIPEMRSLTTSKAGRLSFHASGQVHFAEEGVKAREEFVVKGNQLFNPMKNEIGMRHLFTGFITQPSHKPTEDSPAFNRRSDDSFLTKDLSPVIIIFFAVPNGYTINLDMTVNADYFKIPDHLPGTGTFAMKHHTLYWIAYQQIHLSWPKHNHIAYSDGHSVPLFIGKGINNIDLIFAEPEYIVSEQTLTIRINTEKQKVEMESDAPLELRKESPVIYGTFAPRSWAAIIDTLIFVPFIIFNDYYNIPHQKNLLIFIMISLAIIIYKPLLEYYFGATIGKMALKLKVVTLQYQKPHWKEILLRNIFQITMGILTLAITIYIFRQVEFQNVSTYREYAILKRSVEKHFLSILTFAIFIIDVIFFFTDKKSRALHDRIGKTYVIKQQPGYE